MEAGKDLSFYISGGMYYQPPFYREMRYPDGTINRNIKSQRSVHTVIGMTYFQGMGQTFYSYRRIL
jgi:hypothetical protein